MLLSHLLADPGFQVVGSPPQVTVAPTGLLEALPEQVRAQALAWERHVREIESGAAVPGGVPRAGYDPAVTTLAQREVAKAAELTASGAATSVTTVRRMRARYRAQGVWGLVDRRTTRPSSAVGRADQRVVEGVAAVLGRQRDRSTGTLTRLRDQVRWHLEEVHGPGVVAVPPVSTFNRLVHALADGQGLLGSAAQRRAHGSRPAAPFGSTVALRPGELVMMDSTLLDVVAVLADGVTGRPELTIALDVATRSVCAAVLRPSGTGSVDAAVLLAEMVAPMRMRPGWDAALALQRSVVPYERLLGLDERLRGAAARPVIVPETVVVDQGAVFVSSSFLGACESLGVSLQPVPPANGPAKGAVERTFRSINHRFCQYVAGYTGPSAVERGRRVQDEARWTLPQLQELFDEWLVCGWHARKHAALPHPMLPHLSLSPIEMWGALVGIAGYVALPLAWENHIELLPVRWQSVSDYGIRFDYRTYDSAVLNGHRRSRTSAGAAVQLEVHHNPYDPARIWVRLPGGFEEVPWIHAAQVGMPFTDSTWRHIVSTVARTTDRDAHEVALARALDGLLRRAGAGTGSRRERSVAAHAAAAASLSLGSLVSPAASATTGDALEQQSGEGLAGEGAQRFPGPDELADCGFDEGESGEDEQDCAPDPGPERPSRVLNPYQEAQQWLH
ncbi:MULTISPECIES: Mu transposase C-terminal domain-containing protein [unclassified Kitasatospora]|uniref:Mu transposase C-terminal domain-containing protein n=1 Tax=unclassified Kitasatospora TaxID=2633591 RepID=UPI0038149FED